MQGDNVGVDTLGFAFTTVTIQAAVLVPLLLQLIVTLPGDTAVTFPASSTVATEVLLLLNVMSLI